MTQESREQLTVWGVVFIIVLWMASNYLSEQKTEKEKQYAQHSINEYIDETYGNQFEEYQNYTSVINIVSDTSYHGLKFHKTGLRAYPFTIAADCSGNIIYDGYKDYYIRGGIPFDINSDKFRTMYSDIEADIADCICIEDMPFIDKLSTYAIFNGEQDSEHTFTIHISPVLDPEKDYSFKEICRQYGRIEIFVKTDSDKRSDFDTLASSLKKYFSSTEYNFCEVILFMCPDNDENLRNISAVFSAEDFDNPDFSSVIEDKAIIYTAQQYREDSALPAEQRISVERHKFDRHKHLSHTLF